MVQVKYVEERDELEVIFKEVDVPEFIQMRGGVMLEFSPDELAAIILPGFGRMIHFNDFENATLEFESLEETSLKVKLNGQIVNIKIDLRELENK